MAAMHSPGGLGYHDITRLDVGLTTERGRNNYPTTPSANTFSSIHCVL